MESITIDGSKLEGGGQMVRTTCALANILRLSRPVHIVNIRGNRPKPGLAAQHSTGVRLVSKISGLSVSGCQLGSPELNFDTKSELSTDKVGCESHREEGIALDKYYHIETRSMDY